MATLGWEDARDRALFPARSESHSRCDTEISDLALHTHNGLVPLSAHTDQSGLVVSERAEGGQRQQGEEGACAVGRWVGEEAAVRKAGLLAAYAALQVCVTVLVCLLACLSMCVRGCTMKKPLKTHIILRLTFDGAGIPDLLSRPTHMHAHMHAHMHTLAHMHMHALMHTQAAFGRTQRELHATKRRVTEAEETAAEAETEAAHANQFAADAAFAIDKLQARCTVCMCVLQLHGSHCKHVCVCSSVV